MARQAHHDIVRFSLVEDRAYYKLIKFQYLHSTNQDILL